MEAHSAATQWMTCWIANWGVIVQFHGANMIIWQDLISNLSWSYHEIRWTSCLISEACALNSGSRLWLNIAAKSQNQGHWLHGLSLPPDITFKFLKKACNCAELIRAQMVYCGNWIEFVSSAAMRKTLVSCLKSSEQMDDFHTMANQFGCFATDKTVVFRETTKECKNFMKILQRLEECSDAWAAGFPRCSIEA
jgi:hypothetical protein